MPSRRTLPARPIRFADRCPPALRSLHARSLRHPACARVQGRLDWHGQPLAAQRSMRSTSIRPRGRRGPPRARTRPPGGAAGGSGRRPECRQARRGQGCPAGR